MSDTPDVEAFLSHIASRFESWADEARLNPKSAELWLQRATGAHATIRELRRLQRIEKHARAVNEIFDERDDVLRLRCKVADGEVDHREKFLKLRVALQIEVPDAKGKTECPS